MSQASEGVLLLILVTILAILAAAGLYMAAAALVSHLMSPVGPPGLA